MISSICCFLTCIQIPWEAGMVVWYSLVFKNFPQSVVIHTVKSFGVVNKADVDIFQNSLVFSMVQQLSSVQSLSRVWLFATPWTAAHQASLSITNSQNPPKPMFIELVMPCNHLILCCPLLFLSSIFPSIRVFSKSALHIRWPKYWSFRFNISPSIEHPGLISFRMDWLISMQSKGLSRVFSNTTVQKHQFFSTRYSL